MIFLPERKVHTSRIHKHKRPVFSSLVPSLSPPLVLLYHTMSSPWFLLLFTFFPSSSSHAPLCCSRSRVPLTRTGTPQRMIQSLWRTWIFWVDRRSCRRRRNWRWRWPNPWPRCRWKWRNRIAKSPQWPIWSVTEINGYLPYLRLHLYFCLLVFNYSHWRKKAFFLLFWLFFLRILMFFFSSRQ